MLALSSWRSQSFPLFEIRTSRSLLTRIPWQRNSDVCKIYGNRRPLICVPRHATNTGHSGPASPVSGAFDNADSDADLDADSAADSDSDSEGANEKEKNKNAPEPNQKPKPPVTKPLVEPAGSQAEADDLARQDTETFRNAAAGGGSQGDDEKEGASKAGLSKADQELQDELQAERQRRRRQQRARARGLAESSRRRQGPISTWEACPKVLHREHHDYFEFIVRWAPFSSFREKRVKSWAPKT